MEIIKLKYFYHIKVKVFQTKQSKTKQSKASKRTKMAFYNTLHFEYDSSINGGKEDNYHGEYDDDAYGSLYIPHINSDVATFEQVKRVFRTNKIGRVTSATFTPLAVPSTYKGKDKNKKRVFSATVYVKWYDLPLAKRFEEDIFEGDMKAQLTVDETQGTYWIIRPNTRMTDELLEERYSLQPLWEIATDSALRVLKDGVEEELEEIATDVAMRVLTTF